MTFILGLTGSIGMGKSATAAMFRNGGVPVHDADATVHRLYAGPAVGAVEAAFPGVTVDGAIDRTRLGERVIGNTEAMKRLEAIVHPLVRATEQVFLAEARRKSAPLAVLDIPLLYETGGEKRCQAVAVVSAPAAVQRERVLVRPGMSEERFAAILARQLPDVEKRARAHFVIDTGAGFAFAQRQVDDIIRALAFTV
ncbi:dephospho-CoA kinase [Labrys miyagiensis]|uniref:Dephospho-CoA kinase n=1 Tax=Labrys miyagiensis TaxID=346912 RepID=A0ABQ6CAL8_9HYPH|nr:dephospho-CoA kinase [Labrys miyagiensis]GLS17244.1 dephospho-CoA kinase [Labrys miyagiensis]